MAGFPLAKRPGASLPQELMIMAARQGTADPGGDGRAGRWVQEAELAADAQHRMGGEGEKNGAAAPHMLLPQCRQGHSLQDSTFCTIQIHNSSPPT